MVRLVRTSIWKFENGECGNTHRREEMSESPGKGVVVSFRLYTHMDRSTSLVPRLAGRITQDESISLAITTEFEFTSFSRDSSYIRDDKSNRRRYQTTQER